MVPAAEGLRDQPGRHQVQPRSPVFLRHRGAEQALVADLEECVLGPPFLGVHSRREAVEFLAREAVGLIEDHPLIGVEIIGRMTIVADRTGIAKHRAVLLFRAPWSGVADVAAFLRR